MEFAVVAAAFTCLALGGAMAFVALDVIRKDGRREAAREALLAQLAFPAGRPVAPIADALEHISEPESAGVRSMLGLSGGMN